MIRVVLISTLHVKGSKERKWEGEVHKILTLFRQGRQSAVANGSNCVLGLRLLLSYSILVSMHAKRVSVQQARQVLVIHGPMNHVMPRSFNGCKTPLRSPLWETSQNGKKSAMSRVNRTARYRTRVLWTLGNCRVKPSACTHAWSALIITRGFLTPPATDFHSRNN